MANIFDSESPYVINGQLWIGKTGTQVPNAGLQLGPGTATPNSAPLKMTAGTNLTTPENGAIEYDGSHLYITISGSRLQLDSQSFSGSLTAPVTITGANANALAVGPSGTTNPTFNIDTSVASDATGLNIQGQAAGSGVALSVLSSGTNEGLTITTKGTGNLVLRPGANAVQAVGFYKADGTTRMWSADTTNNRIQYFLGLALQPATGDNTNAFSFTNNAISATSLSIDTTNTRVGIGKTTPGTTLDVAGVITASSSTATPAGGSSSAVLLFGTTAAFGIYYGSGAPTVTAAQGSLYIRSDGSSTSTRLYVNTTGSTTWTNFTSAA